MKHIFEKVLCENCLIFIDFAIKAPDFSLGLALAMSLGDAFAAGRGRREKFMWGQRHPKRVFLEVRRAARQRCICGGSLSSERPPRAGEG